MLTTENRKMTPEQLDARRDELSKEQEYLKQERATALVDGAPFEQGKVIRLGQIADELETLNDVVTILENRQEAAAERGRREGEAARIELDIETIERNLAIHYEAVEKIQLATRDLVIAFQNIETAMLNLREPVRRVILEPTGQNEFGAINKDAYHVRLLARMEQMVKPVGSYLAHVFGPFAGDMGGQIKWTADWSEEERRLFDAAFKQPIRRAAERIVEIRAA